MRGRGGGRRSHHRPTQDEDAGFSALVFSSLSSLPPPPLPHDKEISLLLVCFYSCSLREFLSPCLQLYPMYLLSFISNVIKS